MEKPSRILILLAYVEAPSLPLFPVLVAGGLRRTLTSPFPGDSVLLLRGR